MVASFLRLSHLHTSMMVLDVCPARTSPLTWLVSTMLLVKPLGNYFRLPLCAMVIASMNKVGNKFCVGTLTNEVGTSKQNHEWIDNIGCWQTADHSTREECCRLQRLDCFDEYFTMERCCSSSIGVEVRPKDASTAEAPLGKDDKMIPAADSVDSFSCWLEVDRATRLECCQNPKVACFSPPFTRARCCAPSNMALFPLTREEGRVIMLLSSGLDTMKLSDQAYPSACTTSTNDLFEPVYVFVWIPRVRVTIEQTGYAARIYGPPESNKRLETEVELFSALRSLLLCLPKGAAPDEIETLTKYVTERKLPAYLRPGVIKELELISNGRLVDIVAKVGVPKRDLAFESTSGVPCRSDGCEAFGFSNSTYPSVALTARLSPSAVVIIDVGTFIESEYMRWLTTDPYGNRWLLALEPNAKQYSQHPTHPRLALLQAAVGSSTASGFAQFHLAKAPACSSLLPLQSDPEAFSIRVVWDIGCFTPDGEAVDVAVVSLASVLRKMPPTQEVSMLKIDARGSELDVVLSAGKELSCVRRIQVTVFDLALGDLNHSYPGQRSKVHVVLALEDLGFLLDGCTPVLKELNEEDCLFVRADLLEVRTGYDVEAMAAGEHRWDLPGVGLA